MERLTPAIVDFASALDTLARSQGDIMELVSKWYDIINTDSPGTVSISLSNGQTRDVDNLAKIRSDLAESLSLDEPTVKAINFKNYRSSATIRGNNQYGLDYYDADNTGFNRESMQHGVYRNAWNDSRTACFPASGNLEVSLLDMPRLVMLGAHISTEPITDVTIKVTSPSNALVESGTLSKDVPYYNIVTFVNRNFSGSELPGPVNLTLVYSDGNDSVVRVIPALMSVTYVMFATPGSSSVNIHELVPDLTGGNPINA